MYILLIAIHSVFIITCHFLGLYVLEGIFLISFLYFLLYFSPFFFRSGTSVSQSLSFFSSLSFSPKQSLFLPLSLFSFALFFFLYGVTTSLSATIEYFIYFLIGISIIIFSYMLVFPWKTEIFFDISRFHAILSSGFVIIIGSLHVFWYSSFSSFFILLGISVSLYFFFLFTSSESENPLLFQGAITLVFFTIFSIFSLISPSVQSFPLFFVFLLLFSVTFFEGIPYIQHFKNYIIGARIYLLFLVLIASTGILLLSISEFFLLFFALIAIVFLLSVHVRFCNYITFGFALLGIYLLYTSLFSSLLFSGSSFSALLFAFFLPLCIIGNTYFWEERFLYDFSILHVSSIVFSSIASLYIIFFLPWWASLYFVVSWCIFALWVLFFLSFFRYRYR